MEGLSWLNAEESWMDRVRHTKKPVVVYGMGNGADKLFVLLEEQGIAVADVMASDGFVRGHVYRGFRVKTYREICERYGDVLILLAFATDLADVMGGIRRIAREQEVYAPELPVFGGGIFDAAYAEAHAGELAEVYDRLADGESRRVMAGLLNFRLHGRMEELEAIASPRARAYREILRLTREETYADLGAYTGDTIREFLECTGGYRGIIALEPAEKNFEKLEKYAEENHLENVELHRLAAYSGPAVLKFSAKSGRCAAIAGEGKREVPADSLDHILDGRGVSFVKMDVEGAERPAILGMEATIRRWHPKMLMAAYHRTEDIYTLPRMLWEIWPEARIYLRKHPYIPGWEANFYIV